VVKNIHCLIFTLRLAENGSPITQLSAESVTIGIDLNFLLLCWVRREGGERSVLVHRYSIFEKSAGGET
jgi:hypothetical protein